MIICVVTDYDHCFTKEVLQRAVIPPWFHVSFMWITAKIIKEVFGGRSINKCNPWLHKLRPHRCQVFNSITDTKWYVRPQMWGECVANEEGIWHRTTNYCLNFSQSIHVFRLLVAFITGWRILSSSSNECDQKPKNMYFLKNWNLQNVCVSVFTLNLKEKKVC